jgi:hypothetical protein
VAQRALWCWLRRRDGGDPALGALDATETSVSRRTGARSISPPPSRLGWLGRDLGKSTGNRRQPARRRAGRPRTRHSRIGGDSPVSSRSSSTMRKVYTRSSATGTPPRWSRRVPVRDRHRARRPETSRRGNAYAACAISARGPRRSTSPSCCASAELRAPEGPGATREVPSPHGYETEVLSLVAGGLGTISPSACSSRRTVDHHVSTILRKLDARLAARPSPPPAIPAQDR